MVKILFPEELKGLELSFWEKIYVLAFDMADEVREKRRDALSELPSEEEMRRNLQKVFSQSELKTLREALEGALVSEGEMGQTKVDVASDILSRLKRAPTRASHYYINKRCELLGERPLRAYRTVTEDAQASGGMDGVERMYARVEELMREVNHYDLVRQRALDEIREILQDIRRRDDCPQEFLQGIPDLSLRNIQMDGLITQISWPSRSLRVLRKIGVRTVQDAVEYFGDLENFLDSDVTLWEWAVITTVLRSHQLLPARTEHVVTLEKGIDGLGLNARTYGCLTRRDVQSIADLVAVFRDGIRNGLAKIHSTHNVGKMAYEDFLNVFMCLEIEIPKESCFPTIMSEVAVLDFGIEEMKAWEVLGVETVDDLQKACRCENRLYGLKNIDLGLYKSGVERLQRYGFWE